KNVKKKSAAPLYEEELDSMMGRGISREGDIIDLAAGVDVVEKSGAWYAYEGEKIGQGRENAKAYLESHPEVMEELDRKVRAHYHLGDTPETEEKAGEKTEDKEEQNADLKLKAGKSK